MNKSHEPKTKSERKPRSIYISRKLHADQLAAKAEIQHDLAPVDDCREYTEAELDFMLAEHCASMTELSMEAWA